MTVKPKINLNKKCPQCKKENTIVLDQNKFLCENPDCDFCITYLCPICDQDLKPENFFSPENNPYFICPGCKSEIALQKIQHLIENNLVVDKTTTCHYCNGPTIHRKEMNVAHRCFFFPKCSGQTSLFGAQSEALVFLDFETTGLDIAKNNIIEIGALKIDEEGNEHIFQTFIKPTNSVSSTITKITGITNEMVENAPTLKDSLQAFLDYVGNAKIVAHNTDFDIPWLYTAALRHKIDLKSNQVICTYKWAKANHEPSCSLTALTRKYKILHANAHRALADAVATKELFFIFDNQRIAPRPIKNILDYQALSEKLVSKYESFFQA